MVQEELKPENATAPIARQSRLDVARVVLIVDLVISVRMCWVSFPMMRDNGFLDWPFNPFMPPVSTLLASLLLGILAVASWWRHRLPRLLLTINVGALLLLALDQFYRHTRSHLYRPQMGGQFPELIRSPGFLLDVVVMAVFALLLWANFRYVLRMPTVRR